MAGRNGEESGAERAKFNCRFCQESFDSKGDVIKHIVEVHSENTDLLGNATTNEEVQCKLCRRSFDSNRALANHISRRHVEHYEAAIRSSRHYVCPRCTRPFKRPDNLHSHIANNHPDLLNYNAENQRRNGGNREPTHAEVPVHNASVTRDELERTAEQIPAESADETQNKENPVVETETLARDELPPHCKKCGQVFTTKTDEVEHKKTDCENDEDVPATEDLERTTSPTEPPTKRVCQFILGGKVKQEVDALHTSAHKPPATTTPSTRRFEVPSTTITVPSTSVKREVDSMNRKRLASVAATIGSEPDEGETNVTNLQVKKEVPTASNNTDVTPRDKLDPDSSALIKGMRNRATANPKELLVVWCKTLEEPVLTAAGLIGANTILCIEGAEIEGLSEDGRNIFKENKQKAVFYMSSDTGRMSAWRVIGFVDGFPKEKLHRKIFKKFVDVEAVFTQFAASLGMKVANIMKYEFDGLFQMLFKNLMEKTVGFRNLE